MRPFEFQCQDCGTTVIDWLMEAPSGPHYKWHEPLRVGSERCNGVLVRRYSFGVSVVRGAGGSKAKPSP